MISIVFLGTSSMVPTKERNASSVYLEFLGEGMLFDCGEGTQRQMNLCGINRQKVKKIFITHWHADHTAGLLGLIQTLSSKDNQPEISIYGPAGTTTYMDHVLKSSAFDQQIKIHVHECKGSGIFEIVDTPKYTVYAAYLEHTTPVIGFRFVEKDRRRMKVKKLEELGLQPGPLYAKLQNGKDVQFNGEKIMSDDVTTVVKGKIITFIADTMFCPQAIELAKEAHVVISEATFAGSEEDKARQYKHLTSTQSAQIASMADAQKLYLTHFSQRYPNLQDLYEEAKTIFSDVTLANDFMKIELK
jgi:ribonuclease Z